MQWNMTTHADAKIVDDKTIHLTKDDKKIVLRIVSPQNAKAYIKSNAPTTSYDCENRGTCRVGFAAEVAPNRKSTFKVLLEPQK